jgi:membrane protein YdbS with pleckstrin-like domain
MSRTPSTSSTLPREALRYRVVRSCIEAVIGGVLLASGLVVGVREDLRPVAMTALCALLVLAVTVEIPLVDRALIRSTSYQVDECAVRIRRGVLVERSVVLSTAQLAAVTLVEGPLLRRFGLVVVVFVCATTTERLGPLGKEEAQRVRSVALNLLGAESVHGPNDA